MFSIAAINDVDATQHEWQPLAPTKEAQEFRLTEMYHESLLHLQAGEYKQAQKLLETIIEDPLSINAESQNTRSFDPMRQLRFLSFRNLAEAFLKQGADLHKDALQCFLNAVSIDGKDVTLWNRLGTLACSLDSHNIARWAFEQGLLCSPHHWACMEKLMEVLIAIGDESACLYVAKQLLKISPSHPRALLVKRVIEDNVDPAEISEGAEDMNNHSVLLRGIDKLKPCHYSLCFSKKRKFEDMTPANEATSKKVLQLNLKEASITEFLSKLLEVFESINAELASISEGCDGASAASTHGVDGMQRSGTISEGGSTAVFANAAIVFSFQGKDINEVEMPTSIADGNGLGSETAFVNKGILSDETESFPCEIKLKQDASTRLDTFCDRVTNSCEKINPCEKKLQQDISARLDASCDRVSTMKERETSTDEEPHLERRSSRIERIRTRNFDKIEELESVQPEVSKNKVSLEEFLKLLEPFIVCKETFDNVDPSITVCTSEQEKLQGSDCLEERNVLCFLREHALNSGVYHVAQKLLERLSSMDAKPIESWTDLLRIEKYVRSSNILSPFCSLFLAEVYMDMASSLAGELEREGYLEDCDYHLCRIIGCFAATFSSVDHATTGSTVPKDSKRLDAREQQVDDEAKLLYGQLESCQWSFWVRFYWISGQLHYYQGNCEMANEDFSKCLRILQVRNESEMDSGIVKLPYCGVDKQITAERVQRKLHEVQIQGLLSHSAAQMLEAGHYSDVIELLAPILLSEAGKKGIPMLASKKHANNLSTELTALDVLINACEKCDPKNFNVALQCYSQKLHMHLLTAGIVKTKGLPNNLVQGTGQCPAEGTHGDWFKVVAEEVKRITRFLADFDQKVSEKTLTLMVDAQLLGCMQQILVTVMSQLLTSRAMQRFSNLVSDHSEQSEATCFVEAAVSFCRLQHLHVGTSLEEQVELLVRIHDLLAEHGLCCAGKACEGGEGVFLKMAIKHFLLLEMKLKSTMPEENTSIADETSCDSKDEDCKEGGFTSLADDDELIRADEVLTEEKRVEGLDESSVEKSKTSSPAICSEEGSDYERKKNDLGLDIALDQSFFCLYGLNLRGSMESSGSQDGLAVHANTSLGDYRTKEQCAEVFQYLLPYARVCTKSCLVKLRKVLRSIRQHFPDPPEDVLENNAVDVFLDDMELDENKLSCLVMNHASIREILEYVLKAQSSIKNKDARTFEVSHIDVDGKNEGSQTGGINTCLTKEDGDDSIQYGLYQEVYKNLYYLLTQVEEGSASDKWPGFVFTKEGEEFVEQNAKIIKYDLIYNIGRFESWHKLANLFDEEVDLMLNDGSKTCSALEWHKNESLIKRVEIGRRRTRRCLLMSMALAKIPEQERSVHELLALVYYDTVQNVAPSFNQRHHIAVRDAAWQDNCQKSLLHFEKGLSFRPEWMYLFYLGKLCEKLGEPCNTVLTYYQKAFELNPLAVDALYRLHASRLKLLCSKGTDNLDIMKVIAMHSYNPETVEQANAFIEASESLENVARDGSQNPMPVVPEEADKAIGCAWNILFEDGIQAMEVCIEGELKHYHKARYRLAQSLYARNKGNDVEKAKEELGFCFKSNRSLFIINMWEIDGCTRKTRRKIPGSTGAKRSFEITMPESSRKFITCLRKYLLFYLHLCEKTFDLCTLERAYCSLRVDKKFSLCLADMVQVALGKYIHTLAAAIVQFDTIGTVSNLSLRNLLERFFNLFMEHGGSWSDVVAVSLAEAGVASAPAVSENAIYSYIHRYLYSLEQDYKVDVLESVNEKIKRRFKTPKLVKEVCARVCKHAAIAWCRCLCASLCAITPLQTLNTAIDTVSDVNPLNKQEQLMVELKIDDLFSNMSDFYISAEEVNSMPQFGPMSCMMGVQIKQATAENMDRATALLRQAFIFYRDCTGPFPAGINLFLLQPGPMSGDEILAATLPFGSTLVGVDLSVPRKLLLWAYTLVHGHTCSIAEAVRFCEEQAKTRVKKGASHASPPVSLQDKPALKDAAGATCAQYTSDNIVDDKEKPTIEEQDTSERGCRTLVCVSDTSRACAVVPPIPPTVDPAQKDENFKASVFNFLDS